MQDAVALVAAIDDPYVEREQIAGSDRMRLERLARSLPEHAQEWWRLSAPLRAAAQAGLRVLTG